MANEKKPIKQCRVKADTCFKWHCMGKLFGLSLEDIGLAYMISQIKDDEGNIRYNLIEPEILDLYKETEAEWLALHSAKMKSDPIYRIAFADLNGQRTATTNHYKAEVKRREEYNNRIKDNKNKNKTDSEDDNKDSENDNKDLKEDVITSDEVKETAAPLFKTSFYFEDDDKYIEVYCLESNKENIPTIDNIEKLRKEYTDSEIIQMLERGNKYRWVAHYDDVLAEMYFMNAEPPAEENKEQEEYPI